MCPQCSTVFYVRDVRSVPIRKYFSIVSSYQLTKSISIYSQRYTLIIVDFFHHQYLLGQQISQQASNANGAGLQLHFSEPAAQPPQFGPKSK
jgi:hypothetical protein